MPGRLMSALIVCFALAVSGAAPAAQAQALPDWRSIVRGGDGLLELPSRRGANQGIAPQRLDSRGAGAAIQSSDRPVDPAAILRARGYELLAPPTRRGNTAIADVIGQHGRMRIVIDLETGAIIGIQPLPRR